MQIVLASSSPRRRELLTRLGVEFEVIASQFDESLVESDDPVELAEELAIQKAGVVSKSYPEAYVLGADTVVWHNHTTLGKPTNEAEASQMLATMAGSSHEVITAVAILRSLDQQFVVSHSRSKVVFRPVSEAERASHVTSGIWKDKAGGYALQEDPLKIVTMVEGSRSGVVGLPVLIVEECFHELDLELPVSHEEVLLIDQLR